MNDQLKSKNRQLEFLPPEGVPIHFTVASLGNRIGAQLIDIILTYVIIGVLVFICIITNLLDGNAGFTLIVLSVFLLRIPYYIFSELVWNGQTIGKKLIKIRVINMNGRRLTPHQIAARNILKEVEIFTPCGFLINFAALSTWMQCLVVIWWAVIIIVPLSNSKRQRIGDIVAGTLVVEKPTSVLLPDLVVSGGGLNAQSAKFTFLPEQLEIYGRHELQTLEVILRDINFLQMQDQVQLITQTIIRKINFQEPVAYGQERSFLTEFYKVQREHLEKLRLFGDKRENKFHENETKK